MLKFKLPIIIGLSLWGILNLTAQCSITNLAVLNSDCNSDGLFNIEIDFDYENNGNNGFSVLGNGEDYGDFEYAQLPLTIEGLIGDCETSYEFITRDNDFPSCSAVNELGSVCCSINCMITDFNVEAGTCNPNGTYNLSLEIETLGETSDSVTILLNNSFLTSAHYDQFPLNLNNFQGSGFSQEVFTICDQESPSCCAQTTLISPCICDIRNVNALIVDCDDAIDSFYVLLDADYADIQDFFVLFVNNQSYGNLEYDNLPTKIGPLAIGDEYILDIIDFADPSCSAQITVDAFTSCPPCNFDNFEITNTECDIAGNVDITFSFDAINPVSDQFALYINNQAAGMFSYHEDSYTIGGQAGFCNVIYSISLEDISATGCGLNYTYDDPFCCEPYECSIGNVFAQAINCENGFFDVRINIQSQNTGDNGFEIRGNGISYGTFDYGETFYTITGLNADCETIYEFVIIDNDNSECSNFYSFDEAICCQNECEISGIESFDIECTSPTTYNASFNFTHSETSATFEIKIDGVSAGIYGYAELPIRINDFPTNGDDTFGVVICDNENDDCCSDYLLQIPNCPTAFECEISDVFAEASECNDDGLFYVDVEFDVSNPSNNGFLIRGNGMIYDSFQYGESFYTVGPLLGDCETKYEFIVIDLANEECNASFGFQDSICCIQTPCDLFNVMVEPIECSGNGIYDLSLNFEFDGVTNNSFDVSSQGVFLGSYPFNSLPVTIEDFPERMAQFDIIKICENDNPDCCVEHEFIGLDCIEECNITGVFAEAHDCNADGNFLVDIEFEVTSPVSNSFSIIGNGNDYGTFEYGEDFYTVGPLSGDCETIYEFIIVDQENDDCKGEYAFEEPICCDPDACMIFDIEVDPIECDGNGTYSLSLDFEYQGNTNEFFDVIVSGQNLGFYKYEDLPITINNFPERDVAFDIITICDNDNQDCCLTHEFVGLNCINNGECTFSNINPVALNCDANDEFLVNIFFDVFNQGGQGFEIRGNGNSYGTFDYGQPFYTIGPLQGDCETLYEFIIIDIENDGCNGEGFFDEPICCNQNNCMIFDIIVDPIECTGNGTYDFSLNFSFSGIANPFFDVFGPNDVFLGFYSFNDLPITIEDYPQRMVPEDIIKVCENDNPDCCTVFEFPGLDCFDDLECLITNVFAEAEACNQDGQFFVAVEFEVANPNSNSFEIRGNGNSYGTFEYGEDSYRVGPLEGDCETIYEFVVIDSENNDCSAAFGFEEPICCGDCAIDDFVFDNFEVDEDGNLLADLSFDYFNTGNLGFDVFVNDQPIGFYSYDDLPVRIKIPLVNFGTTFELKVCDNDSDCCQSLSVSLDNITLCNMSNIAVETSECDGDFFEVTLDFENNVIASDSFTVFGNSTTYGTFAYSELPITIGPLEGDAITNYSFSISDQLFIDCGILGELGVINCDPNATEEYFWNNVTFETSTKGITVGINGYDNIQSVEIYDINGMKLQQSQWFNSPITMGGSFLKTSVYIIKINSTNGFYSKLVPFIE